MEAGDWANRFSRTCIIIPAYNEETTIQSVLIGLIRLRYSIIVVNDGSTDSTAKLAAEFPITLLNHLCNLGQGAALRTGIEYALGIRETRYIVTFDADGQHDPEDIERLLGALIQGKYDIVLGSRFIDGGDSLNIPYQKRILLNLATLFTRLTTHLKISDTHNGLRAMTAETARKVTITQNRMAHASEILAKIANLKLRYCEVPVVIRYSNYSKQKGQSIFESINILWEMMVGRMR